MGAPRLRLVRCLRPADTNASASHQTVGVRVSKSRMRSPCQWGLSRTSWTASSAITGLNVRWAAQILAAEFINTESRGSDGRQRVVRGDATVVQGRPR